MGTGITLFSRWFVNGNMDKVIFSDNSGNNKKQILKRDLFLAKAGR